MFFIFASDKLILTTYTDLLADFNPIPFSKKNDLLEKVNEAKVVLIDDDAELALNIQKKETSIAILMLTEHPENFEQTDYTLIKKPFHFSVLRSKVLFLKSVCEKGLTLSFETSSYLFNGPARTLFNKSTQQEIRLTEKEAQIIQFLYENKNNVISKDELLEKIFGYKSGVETHTVETHIYKLRQKVQDENEYLIKTLNGGYQINLA